MERVLAVLEGHQGVHHARRTNSPKTLEVTYDSTRTTAEQLVTVVNRADIRLEAHHRFRRWFRWLSHSAIRNTARLISDEFA